MRAGTWTGKGITINIYGVPIARTGDGFAILDENGKAVPIGDKVRLPKTLFTRRDLPSDPA